LAQMVNSLEHATCLRIVWVVFCVATTVAVNYAVWEGRSRGYFTQIRDQKSDASNHELLGRVDDQVRAHFNKVRQSVRVTEFKPYYLHVPKTGSSFQRVLTATFCPECGAVLLPILFSSSSPCKKTLAKCTARFRSLRPGHSSFRGGDPSNLVFLLRDPIERIVSGYFHNYHDCGRLQKSYGISPHSQSAAKFLRAQVEAVEGGIVDYSSCVNGCAVNMLNGRKCGSRKPNKREVSLAMNRTQNAAFVGLTGSWEETIELFLRIFDVNFRERGGNSIYSQFLENTRSGGYEPEHLTRARLVLRNSSFHDEDQHVYDVAVSKFCAWSAFGGKPPAVCTTQHIKNVHHELSWFRRMTEFAKKTSI